MSTRRQFLKASAITVGGFIVPWKSGMANTDSPPLDPDDPIKGIPKFVDPLPIPAILKPTGNSKNAASYKVTMSEFQQQVLPANSNSNSKFPKTTVWGYEGSFPGPTIEARRDKPVAVKWINELPLLHLFPVDITLHGTDEGEPEVKTVVHLHGAHTKPQFDGYPEDWYASNESKNFATANYKNDQEPAALWYHDHAMGSTRTNVYAGLAGLYNIRDDIEDALNLPSGDYEVPIVIQDRLFTEDGALFYPTELNSDDFPFAPSPSVIPVLIGNITVVNGKTWPFFEVEARKYRFRVLNGSNSRPYRLRLVPDAAPDTSLPYHQIGTDGGLLDKPVPVGRVVNGVPKGPQVTVAPAERADIVVDFSGFAGGVITMKNLGIRDFPSSESVESIMQFRVIEGSGPDTSELPAMLRPVPRLDPADAVKTRNLTLDKVTDDYGRPKFLLNNTRWMEPITEKPRLNTTEIWNFINMTTNGHPMHVHLVTFGVLSRRRFDVAIYRDTGEIVFTGPEMLPPNENGMRDMVRVPAGTVVQIIAHFDVPGRFVWHCHFLDHEDHEMMRPFEVVAGNSSGKY